MGIFVIHLLQKYKTCVSSDCEVSRSIFTTPLKFCEFYSVYYCVPNIRSDCTLLLHYALSLIHAFTLYFTIYLFTYLFFTSVPKSALYNLINF